MSRDPVVWTFGTVAVACVGAGVVFGIEALWRRWRNRH